MKQEVVQFCCVCGKVRDDLKEKGGPGPWVDLRRFRMIYGFRMSDLRLRKTYCPECAGLRQAAMKPRRTAAKND